MISGCWRASSPLFIYHWAGKLWRAAIQWLHNNKSFFSASSIEIRVINGKHWYRIGPCASVWLGSGGKSQSSSSILALKPGVSLAYPRISSLHSFCKTLHNNFYIKGLSTSHSDTQPWQLMRRKVAILDTADSQNGQSGVKATWWGNSFRPAWYRQLCCNIFPVQEQN